MEHTAYISLGSNMGNRIELLGEALRELEDNGSIRVVNVSSIYETDPVGYEDQALFLNMVAQINTDLSPIKLLDTCQEIEKGLGRKRDIRWGPRTIDLDILLYNNENVIMDRLVIPHPRLHERSFVVVPLLEIHPDITLPSSGMPLCEIAEQLTDREGVRIWKQKNGEDVFALFAN